MPVISCTLLGLIGLDIGREHAKATTALGGGEVFPIDMLFHR